MYEMETGTAASTTDCEKMYSWTGDLTL